MQVPHLLAMSSCICTGLGNSLLSHVMYLQQQQHEELQHEEQEHTAVA